MSFGKLRYHVVIKVGGRDASSKTLRLTLIGSKDESILSSRGLSELRKNRIMRLTGEAQRQGLLLGYDDLNALLLSSVSTLKRDISSLEKLGYVVPIRGKRGK